jgi:crossover junction endodeoxyribonuclease RuvC
VVVWNGEILWASDVKTEPPDDDVERIAAIAGLMMEAVEAVHPVAAVIEGYSTGPRSGRKVLTRLGELGGVLKHWLWCNDIPFMDPAPSQVKEFATGFGDASKNTMLRVARRTWPECPHHDLADAFHMARMGYAKYDEWFA